MTNYSRHDAEHVRTACRALLGKAEMHRGLVATTRWATGLTIGHSRLANLAMQHAAELVALDVAGGRLNRTRGEALLAGYEALLWRGQDVHATHLLELRTRLIACADSIAEDQLSHRDGETEG